MLEDLDSALEIASATDTLLQQAAAYRRFPTPIDDLVHAAGLSEPKVSLLSDLHIDRAPAHLATAMRLIRGKLEGLLDRRGKEVHVHPEIEHDAHRNFVRLHEVGHDILPWQRELAYADDRFTLAPTIDRLFEREANQTASELLFQRDVFTDVAAEYDIGLAAVIELGDRFGSSIRATLRRFAETHREAVAAIILDRQPLLTDPLTYRRREAVSSGKWRARLGYAWDFPARMALPKYDFLITAAAVDRVAQTLRDKTRLVDRAGEYVDLQVEVLDNGYHLLVLLWVPRKRIRIIRRRRQMVGMSTRSGPSRFASAAR